MAYGFNDDKSKAEVYSKEDLHVSSYSNGETITINAFQRITLAIPTDIDSLNNKIVGVQRLLCLVNLVLVGWNIIQNDDTAIFYIMYYNPTSTSITVHRNDVSVTLAYFE